MAKKIRKKGRRKITKWVPGLLVLAAVIFAIAAIEMIGESNESDSSLSGFLCLFEIVLFGTVILIAPLIISLTRKLKRKDKGEGDDSPYY